MFEELTNERNYHQNIEGLNPASARRLKSYAKDGKVSIEKMEEILMKAGKQVVQEKLLR